MWKSKTAAADTAWPAVLGLLTLTTLVSFHQIDRRASVLLLPYVGWTSYAALMMNLSADGHEDEVCALLALALESMTLVSLMFMHIYTDSFEHSLSECR